VCETDKIVSSATGTFWEEALEEQSRANRKEKHQCWQRSLSNLESEIGRRRNDGQKVEAVVVGIGRMGDEFVKK
jgi:hypothetical protein